MVETLDSFQNTSVGYSQNQVIYEFTTKSSVLLTKLTVKVYVNRVSLEYRPIWGGGETRKTYNAVDIGDVSIKKGLRRASISVCRTNSSEKLFAVGNLKKDEAEALKDAVDCMMGYRYDYVMGNSFSRGNNRQLRPMLVT